MDMTWRAKLLLYSQTACSNQLRMQIGLWKTFDSTHLLAPGNSHSTLEQMKYDKKIPQLSISVFYSYVM